MRLPELQVRARLNPMKNCFQGCVKPRMIQVRRERERSELRSRAVAHQQIAENVEPMFETVLQTNLHGRIADRVFEIRRGGLREESFGDLCEFRCLHRRIQAGRTYEGKFAPAAAIDLAEGSQIQLTGKMKIPSCYAVLAIYFRR